MRKNNKSITNPDELNKNLQYSSPITWVVLTSVVLLLLGFFAWSFIYKIRVKVFGTANIISGNVTLRIDEAKLNELEEGQKVYISGLEGQILSFNDNQPVVSNFALEDGEYDCYIVLKETKPIYFLLSK